MAVHGTLGQALVVQYLPARMTQEEANLYWRDKEFKKWVVTLERGPARKPEVEIKYVGATTRDRAIITAKANASRVNRPTRVSCRLATAQDLGCMKVVVS